jgi:hypothetical protein
MNVVRVLLGLVVLLPVILTNPAVSAAGPAISDPDVVYTVRVERGKANRVQFRLVAPYGDSIVEAEHFDFLVTRKGLLIKPRGTALASGTAGSLLFENFEMFLPIDGSEPFMEAKVPTR